MTLVETLVIAALLIAALAALATLAAATTNLVGSGGHEEFTGTPGRRQRYWQVERVIYRHHRITGPLIALASVAFLWQAGGGTRLAAWAGQPGFSLLWWALVAGHAATLIIGLVILVRPSRLKPLEDLFNAGRELENPPSPAVARPGRLRNLLLLICGAVVLAGMLVLLIERLGAGSQGI